MLGVPLHGHLLLLHHAVLCCAVLQAEMLLSEEAQERASVSDLKLQLQDLQEQVDEASQVCKGGRCCMGRNILLIQQQQQTSSSFVLRQQQGLCWGSALKGAYWYAADMACCEWCLQTLWQCTVVQLCIDANQQMHSVLRPDLTCS
jgi:hypothetical protein